MKNYEKALRFAVNIRLTAKTNSTKGAEEYENDLDLQSRESSKNDRG